MTLSRLLWRSRDPPVCVHLVMRHGAVSKTDVFLVGSEDKQLLIADGLEDFLIPGHGGFVVLSGDEHLSVIDHVGSLKIELIGGR